MTTYRSKIGLEIMMPASLILVWILIRMTSDGDWLGIAIMILAGLFFAHLLLTTYYSVSENQLVIRCSFLINMSIGISSIKTIRESRSILGAPAASLDRLEISYNDYDSVLISPRDKEAFIEHMLRINPNILVIRKNT